MKIGGNTYATIEVKTATQNDIGEDVETWAAAYQVIGFIDLTGGDADLSRFNAKVQQSTHVFLCDYFPLTFDNADGEPEAITAENSRMVVDGNVYEVMLYDDPVGLHEHYEIYLKFIGG